MSRSVTAYVHEVLHLLPLHAALELALLSSIEPAKALAPILGLKDGRVTCISIPDIVLLFFGDHVRRSGMIKSGEC